MIWKFSVVFGMLASQVSCYNVVVEKDEIRFVRPIRNIPSYSTFDVKTTSIAKTPFIYPTSDSIERAPPPIEISPPPLKPSLAPIEGNSFFGYDISISSSGSGQG